MNANAETRTAEERLIRLWSKLSLVSALEFEALSGNPKRKTASGKGRVRVLLTGPATIVFEESGVWRGRKGKPFSFRNSLRWSRLETGRSVRLERLRRGAENLVFLLETVPSYGGTWASERPHLCGKDAYSATLRIDRTGVELQWRVEGESKDDLMRFRYACVGHLGNPQSGKTNDIHP